MIESLIIGALIASTHCDNGNPAFTDYQNRRVHNGLTPGLYLLHEQTCLTAGIYRNSWRRQAAFAGCSLTKTLESNQAISIGLTAGLVSGYAHSKILLAPSIQYGPVRLFAIPGNLPTVSLAIEHRF